MLSKILTTLQVRSPLITAVRNTSFFNKLPAELLWKGVTSVSNAGKKRGRARGLMRARDLNRGQVIGIGRSNIVWPGLTGPIVRGKEMMKCEKLPPDDKHFERIFELRDKSISGRSLKLHPLERGWSGAKMPGRRVGPPDPIGEDHFEGFDTIVLHYKIIATMKGNLGRKRRYSAFVVTGNQKGLVGIAEAKSIDGRAALRKARNRAGQKLMYFDLLDGHTVWHDFFCQFSASKLYVYQKPEGFGIRAHRVVAAICKALGIKNIHVKAEGSMTGHAIAKAFLVGLLQMKNHQQLAEEKKLHVVEMRSDLCYYPKIAASPQGGECRKKEEIDMNEVLDFSQYCMNDRIPLVKKKWPPFYTRLWYWPIHEKKQEYQRNKIKIRNDLLHHYGELRSFLTDKYPEALTKRVIKKKNKE